MADALQAFMIKRAAVNISLRKSHRFHEHSVVVLDQWLLFEDFLRLSRRLDRIPRQHALVQLLLGQERWCTSQEDFEELEAFDVAAEDDEADRQRRSQDETDRAPQPSPERSRGNHRHRGPPAAVAINQWFDDMAHDRLSNQ